MNEILDTLLEEQEYLNKTCGDAISEEETIHDDANSTQEESCGDATSVTFEQIREELEMEIDHFMHVMGNAHYRIAKFLYEKTRNMNDREKARTYRWIAERTGLSVGTIKNLTYVYRKLCSFLNFHMLKGFTKWKFFQLTYYMSKRTNQTEHVMKDIYKRIMTERSMLEWFENADYKAILNWAKEEYKEYFKYFPKVQVVFTCECCHAQLPYETRGETWDLIPMHYDCLEVLKETNPSKVGKLLKQHRETVHEDEYKLLKAELSEIHDRLELAVKEIANLRRQNKKLRKQNKRLKEENAALRAKIKFLEGRLEKCLSAN